MRGVATSLAAIVLASENNTQECASSGCLRWTMLFAASEYAGRLWIKMNIVVVDATKPLTEEALRHQQNARRLPAGSHSARNGHAKVSMPGGCTWLVADLLTFIWRGWAMGAQITQTGYIEAKADRLMGRIFTWTSKCWCRHRILWWRQL